MKTNILKIVIAVIIAIACSCYGFCHSDECQNPSLLKTPSQVQLVKEKIILDKSSDDWQSSDDYHVYLL